MAISSAPSWFYKDSQGRLVNSPSTAGRVLAWGAIVGLIIDDATIDPYAAASGAGKSIFQRTQSAAVGSGLAGGSYSFEMGLGDGAGVQGLIKSNGGVAITPATAAVGLFIDQNNDAVGLNIDSEASSYYGISITGKYGATITQDIANGRGLSVSRNISEAGTYSLVKFTCDNGTDTKALLELQQDGTGPHITTGATNQNLDIAPNGTGEVWFRYNSIQNFHMSGAAVAAYAGAATVAGQGWFVQLQNGGAAAAAEGFAGASGTLTAGSGSAAVLGAGGAGGGWRFVTGTGGNGTTAGGSGGNYVVVCGNAGTGGTGTNGSFQVWHGTEAGGDYVSFYHNATDGCLNTGSGIMRLMIADTTYARLSTTAFYADAAQARDLGITTAPWKGAYLGQDTTTSSVSTSGVYFGAAQEVRLRWNKDATAMPAASLILGLNAVGSAAKDTIAFSAAAITGFNALTGVAGSILYCAMQSGLDNNMAGGSLDWSGGTAHGSGTGGSLFLHPGGTTSGTRGNVTIYQDGIATTSTDGLVLENTTAATVDVPVQYSAALRFRAHAFDIAPDSVDRTVDWRISVVPASGATVTSTLYFQHSLDGAAYTTPLTVNGAGGASIGNGVLNCGTVAPASAITLSINNTSYSAADSAIEAATGAWTHSSGEGVAMEIKPTWNASGTAGEICLKLNPTKSAVGSGVYLGIDARGWAAGDAILGVPVDEGALGAYYGRTTVYVNGVGLKVIPLYEVA